MSSVPSGENLVADGMETSLSAITSTSAGTLSPPQASAYTDMSVLDELFPCLGNGDSSSSHFTSQLALLINTLNSSNDEVSIGPSLFNPLQFSPPRLSELHALATANLVTQTQEAIMQEYNITDYDLHKFDMSTFDALNTEENSDVSLQACNGIAEPLTSDINSDQGKSSGNSLMSSNRRCNITAFADTPYDDKSSQVFQGDSLITSKVPKLDTSSINARSDSVASMSSLSLPGPDMSLHGLHQTDQETSYDISNQTSAMSASCHAGTLEESSQIAKTLHQQHHLNAKIYSPSKPHADLKKVATQSCSKTLNVCDPVEKVKFTTLLGKCSNTFIRDSLLPNESSNHLHLTRHRKTSGEKSNTDCVSSSSSSECRETREVKDSTIKETRSQSGVLYMCNVCAKAFHNIEDLEKHSSKHQTYSCPFPGCIRTFAYRSHLSYHRHTHTGERSFQCVVCGKLFTNAQHLDVHMRSHNSEKLFKCTECDKSFSTAGNLKNHMRIHSGDRPYQCDVSRCNKSFAELSSLKKHKVTHTGERSYRCDLCGKCFTQASSRSYHMKKHRELPGIPTKIASNVT